jgi:hypothetical protein
MPACTRRQPKSRGSVPTFRRKRILVEAVQQNNDDQSWDAVCTLHVNSKLVAFGTDDGTVPIETPNGRVAAGAGDWTLKSARGHSIFTLPTTSSRTMKLGLNASLAGGRGALVETERPALPTCPPAALTRDLPQQVVLGPSEAGHFNDHLEPHPVHAQQLQVSSQNRSYPTFDSGGHAGIGAIRDRKFTRGVSSIYGTRRHTLRPHHQRVAVLSRQPDRQTTPVESTHRCICDSALKRLSQRPQHPTRRHL